ncbi:Single-stranded DNA-binding protein, partial [Dysosmobacter welbionis]
AAPDPHQAGALAGAVRHRQGGLSGGDGRHPAGGIHGGNAVIAAAPGISAAAAGDSQGNGLISHGHGELRPGGTQVGDGQCLRQGGGIRLGGCGGAAVIRVFHLAGAAALRHGHAVSPLRVRRIRV